MVTESLLSVQPEADEPEKQWQRNVLGTIRSSLGPIDPVKSIRDPEVAGTLVEALSTAVQTQEPLKPSVLKLLAEMNKNDPEA